MSQVDKALKLITDINNLRNDLGVEKGDLGFAPFTSLNVQLNSLESELLKEGYSVHKPVNGQWMLVRP